MSARLYDDASWHEPEDGTPGAASAPGATHIGLFLAWMLLNGQGSGVQGASVGMLERREVTPGAWFRDCCGARLTDREFSAEGNRFAAAYYVLEEARLAEGEPCYLTDVRARLGHGGDSGGISDDWASFDRLAPILAHRFAMWRGLEKGRS